MKAILGYIRAYLVQANWPVHLLTLALLAMLVLINYRWGLNQWLYQHSLPGQMAGWFCLLLISLGVPYLLYRWLEPRSYHRHATFAGLLLAAPLLFAWKMTWPIHPFSNQPHSLFWNQVIYFPAKVLGICLALWVVWLLAGKDERWMGLRTPSTSMQTYWLMLLVMVPLVMLAATQPDFQTVYPKLQHAFPKGSTANWYQVLLFELAYGSDFITIELFFRGFLVIYFARWAGAQAILPMAAFYCVIHFGKPLGECISSFFGGMLLGIVSYRTQSIWGGLVVHLGIAWLMEGAPGLIKPLLF
ncbi:hypothetical protein SAMN05444008_1042 [Cnuella takakiae]|uniref:CAAX prenyl protease 2/Lysostaphin resistance protein A-like domain-containing protein n=1 Tax=Cnuella takakiae TaxID=1302690 RepID=A0A1M4XQV8_9BACT|nr:CPBP family intramembrane glutamic endopeptidase [Cnuella takakiae]OLY92911.1 hypothetical protein BUE76_14195 [Cnuella takakiae]SHE95800.1 hypothetical protein SAMN05444008_1042 [Cnuella takakiae]